MIDSLRINHRQHSRKRSLTRIHSSEHYSKITICPQYLEPCLGTTNNSRESSIQDAKIIGRGTFDFSEEILKV